MSMVADQNVNAKLLVEKGIGLEVQWNPDGSFDRDAIAKSTRLPFKKKKKVHEAGYRRQRGRGTKIEGSSDARNFC
ncbi:hypothetical protein FH972_005746 [Carpinus fangiana]|uniref:Uncharacterized protein n=1 Tax=Carpinus fangiana TaxID=176857 RepID=A0A5N6QTG9_9ROSI|nr:hypothetical protein FH972_005746 [Carpinus fangiana]